MAEVDVSAAGATLDYAVQNFQKAWDSDEKQNLEFAKGLAISIGGLDPTGISPALLRIVLAPADEPDPTLRKLEDLDTALTAGFGRIEVAFDRLEVFITDAANRGHLTTYRASIKTIENDLNAYYGYKPSGPADPQASTLDAKVTIDDETPIQNFANFIEAYCDGSKQSNIFTDSTKLQYGDISQLESEGVGLVRELERLEKDYLQIETKAQTVARKSLLTAQEIATLTRTAHSHFNKALDACKKAMANEIQQVLSDPGAQARRISDYVQKEIKGGTSKAVAAALGSRYPRLDWFALQTTNPINGSAYQTNTAGSQIFVSSNFNGHTLVYGYAPKFVIEQYPSDRWSQVCKATFDGFYSYRSSFRNMTVATDYKTYYKWQFGSTFSPGYLGSWADTRDGSAADLAKGVNPMKDECQKLMGSDASITQVWAAFPTQAGAIDYATSTPASHAFGFRGDATFTNSDQASGQHETIDYVVVLGAAPQTVQSGVNASLRGKPGPLGRTDTYFYLQSAASATYLNIQRPLNNGPGLAKGTVAGKELMDVAGNINSAAFRILSTTSGSELSFFQNRVFWTLQKLTDGNYDICQKSTPSQCVSFVEDPATRTFPAVLVNLPDKMTTDRAEWRLVPQ